MKPNRCAGIALAVLAAVLAGCSSDGDHASPAAPALAPASQWLAVARGEVDVEGGMLQVAARGEGVVESIAVKQGDVVKQHQVLATLDPRAAKIATASAEAGVAEAQANLAELRVALKQARQRAPRIAEAAKAGAATGEAAAQAQDAVATLTAKQQAAAAAVDAARQQLAAAQLALVATTLRAPAAGTVVARHIAIGQTVSPALPEPLFELLPERPHTVRAQVNADAANGIHAGMRAEVVAESGSGPVYHATVLWVGEVLQRATLATDPLQRALSNDVDCTLRLDAPANGEPPLRIGQRVLVRFPRK